MSDKVAAVTGLRARLHAIMKDVDYIHKDGRNDFHRYSYATESAIKGKLHAAMVEHGVLFHFSADDVTQSEYQTDKGKRECLTTLKCSYAFIDVETGERLEGLFVGSGVDSADKGVYKAVTGAIKYILTSTFLIPTGDDPEVDDSPRSTQNNQAAASTATTTVRRQSKPKQEPPPKPAPGMIDEVGHKAIKDAFKKALPLGSKNDAKRLFDDWMIEANVLDENGMPDVMAIPAADLDALTVSALEYARKVGD